MRRGRAKSGTTHFYVFATLYVVKKNRRYTLAIVLMRQTEKAQDVVERLLARGESWVCVSNDCILTEDLTTMAWSLI